MPRKLKAQRMALLLVLMTPARSARSSAAQSEARSAPRTALSAIIGITGTLTIFGTDTSCAIATGDDRAFARVGVRALTAASRAMNRAAHAALLRHAQRVVVFTGAEMSNESGTPDFRSLGGVRSGMKTDHGP
jgi:hypothetical protein